MNILLLSGGSGKRLWPLSNDVRSKQFLKLFKDGTGEFESMAQRVYRQIKTVSPDSTVTVATGENQVSAIRNQLGGKVGICVEPSRRDTFPAIALACAYLKSERGLTPEDVVIVCPVDPYVEIGYFQALQRLEAAVTEGGANLTLMGVKPTYPSEKYGYIIPENGTEAMRNVSAFQEKPDLETAKRYIAQGALWNCGVFAFRLGYLLHILQAYIPFDRYQDVYDHYDRLPKISFDYAVAEKETSVKCIEFSGAWKDVGTWNTLTEVMDTPAIGKVVLDDTCGGVHVINELDVPVLVMGAQDMVVAASADGILVSSKEQSSNMKPYVEKLGQRVMFEEKSWGTFTILNIEKNALTIKLHVNAGKSMRYHMHEDRNEIWTVLSGEGEIRLDGVIRKVSAGDVIRLPKGVRHTLRATTDMRLIETQLETGVPEN